MIILVVFGHLIEPIINKSAVIKTIYMFIYSFHMPIFIILAGALTKLDVSAKQTSKNIKTLIVPFLIFTVLYEIFNFIGTQSISSYTSNLQPYWILWFLFSLFIWKVTLPIIMQFKFPLLLSVVISLLAGYVSEIGYFLGLSRTLYFFPFFILGYKLGSSILSNKFLIKIPPILYVAVLIANVAVFWLFQDMPRQWLYGSLSYERLGNLEWYSFIIRSLLYFISFASSVAILMLMSSRESILSTRGKNSLFVYVWHGFFVKVAIYFGVLEVLGTASAAFTLITLLILAALITAVLSCAFVAKLTDKLLFVPAQRILLIKSQYK